MRSPRPSRPPPSARRCLTAGGVYEDQGMPARLANRSAGADPARSGVDEARRQNARHSAPRRPPQPPGVRPMRLSLERFSPESISSTVAANRRRMNSLFIKPKMGLRGV